MERTEGEQKRTEDHSKFGSAVLLIGVCIFAVALSGMCAVFLGVLYDGYRQGAWLPVFQRQFVATIGIPFCILVAVGVVQLFKGLHGSIQFQAGPVKFAGATGPVVLWIFCFLALVSAMKMLWV